MDNIVIKMLICFVKQIDSTWIIFNQPSDEQGINTYAGFLMGLGLNGHLSSLNAFYLFEYLQQKHEVTVIGLLLGLAVARYANVTLHSQWSSHDNINVQIKPEMYKLSLKWHLLIYN